MSFCLYNKKNITRRLEDMNFIFSWQKQHFTHSLRSFVKYCFAPRKKIHNFAPPCNILSILQNYVWTINQSNSLTGFQVVTSLDGINGRFIQTLLRGKNYSKQSSEIQAWEWVCREIGPDLIMFTENWSLLSFYVFKFSCFSTAGKKRNTISIKIPLLCFVYLGFGQWLFL